jgi:hypothetical protein
MQRAIDHGYQLEGQAAVWVLNHLAAAAGNIAVIALWLAWWLLVGVAWWFLFAAVLYANVARFLPLVWVSRAVVMSWPAGRHPGGWSSPNPTDEGTDDV